MKALSATQPNTQLVALGVQTIITRATTTEHRGRIAIVANKKRPDWRNHAVRDECCGLGIVLWDQYPPEPHGTVVVTDDSMLPLGAVVGSAVLTDAIPVMALNDVLWQGAEAPDAFVAVTGDSLIVAHDGGAVRRNVTDQLPFSDFTPGRWAYLLEDAQPCEARCPWCWGDPPSVVPGICIDIDGAWWHERDGKCLYCSPPCPLCAGAGTCAPPEAHGKSGLWEWTL